MYSLDLILIVVVCLTLPLCVWRPWVGVLIFSWLGYMNPHRLIGGVAYDFPLSKLVAVATLIGLLFTKERAALPRRPALYLLLALWLVFLASTSLTAIDPGRAWPHFVQTTKVMLMALVTIVLFQDRARLRWLILVIALSIGSLAVGGGVMCLASGMQLHLYGPPHSDLGDNNALGFALNMTLPLLVYLRQEERGPWLRAVLLVTYMLTLVAVFGTYSRGSFLVLCLILTVLAILLRAKDKPLLLASVATLLLLWSSPKEWVTRMQTITPTVYRDDSSGSERMKSWYVAYHLGIDHPVLGAGFRPFSPQVYQHYLPGYSDHHDAHNHYLQVFAEHGVTGLALFLGLLGSVSISLWRLATPFGPAPGEGDRWRRNYARMIGVALVAWAAGGVFISLAYFDLFFQLMAVAIVLPELAER